MMALVIKCSSLPHNKDCGIVSRAMLFLFRVYILFFRSASRSIGIGAQDLGSHPPVRNFFVLFCFKGSYISIHLVDENHAAPSRATRALHCRLASK